MDATRPAPPVTAPRLRAAGRWVFLAAAVVLAWPLPGQIDTAVVLPALSPFVALCSALALRTAGALTLIALPLVVLALLRPRWFCRHACPAGLLQETVGRCRPRLPWRSPRLPALGQWLLAFAAGAALFGNPLLLWLDPLALCNGCLNAWRHPMAATSLLAGLGLPLLLGFDFLLPRVWCRRLCPLGATQDLLFRPKRMLRAKSRGRENKPPLLPAAGRRLFLGGCAGAAGAWLVGKTSARTPPLRPPGALDEARFRGVCVRCGNCVRACPSRILAPDLGASGAAGFLTPVVRFGDDYCREDCLRCGQACPSGAIARLSPAEKRRRPIGPAVVDLDLCWLAAGRECTACIKRCPWQAISPFSADGGFTLEPRVEPENCTGCGACQTVCPVRPDPAIRVVPPVPNTRH